MNRKRKKLQRKLNKLLRDTNKSLIEDDLWNGRFAVRQMYSDYEEFSDKSGAYLFSCIRLLDRKSGYYKDVIFEYHPWDEVAFGRFNWNYINKFIVEDCDAWNFDKPYEEMNIKYSNEFDNRFIFKNWGYNWHLSRKYFNQNDFFIGVQ